MGNKIQSLPGFRDFFPEDCAVRNYVFEHWHKISRLYGFHQYDGPILEPTGLYQKKSGPEILNQLFHFEDRGEREVSMRPELTPTLARMAAARQRDYKKPLRWFSIGQFFRYEKPQKGRTREFYQLNADILGEDSKEADAELIAFSIDLMLSLGFTKNDFIVRLSDREVWIDFMRTESLDLSLQDSFLQVIDKMGREKDEITNKELATIGTSRDAVEEFIGSASDSKHFSSLLSNLAARGLSDYVSVDLSVVRGLAYYTGPVFEVFDTKKSMRAIAGGGRYDKLCSLISDGTENLPACGFAMGDVVITDLIKQTKSANSQLLNYLGIADSSDVYVIVADEENRTKALATVQILRANGYRVDYPLTQTKVGKQFANAENLKARVAVIIGTEYPTLVAKDLINRVEQTAESSDILQLVESIINTPPQGPLIA